MSWSRSTKWHQGSLLSDPGGLSKLGLSQSQPTIAMAVSHSCDIAHEDLAREPFIEFVSCTHIEKEDGQCTFGKNPRILHLPVLYKNNAIILQLTAVKHFIRKEILLSYMPDNHYVLDISAKYILQSWLSSRYRRHAFPDSLVNRINPIFDFLTKQGKKYTSGIVGYWFSVDPEVELSIEEPYDIELQIVYSIDNPDFEKTAIQMTQELNEKFSGSSNSKLRGIELRICEAIPETAFTLWDLRHKIEFKLEYLSNRII